MRNIIFFFICILCLNSSYAQKKRNHITDPMITLKCNYLFDDREKKVATRQKAKALLWRNRQLLADAPINKQKAINRLKYTSQRLTQEVSLLSLKITKLEEKLIRKGCPGIRL